VLLSISFFFLVYILLDQADMEYAYTPPTEKIVNPNSSFLRTLEQPKTLGKRNQHGEVLDEHLISIDQDFLDQGRQNLYQETFGNEYFFSDLMGVLDGPINLKNFSKALLKLKGQGTSNLQIELEEQVTIGGRVFQKGEKIDTGIDVAKGSLVPLGYKIKYAEGKVKMGLTCMACHATVDRQGMVIEGAPNTDLNVGVLLAMAPNSAAFFTHTDIKHLENYLSETSNVITSSENKKITLPDIQKFEEAVDRSLLKWPKGHIDTSIDMVNNPGQIPDAFTFGDFPYGWSGFAAVGPFEGLSVFTNNVNAQNTDPLSQIEVSQELFGIDKELYIATILQNAANKKFRYDPGSGLKPSEFLEKVDPTPGVPGLTELIKMPTFPKANYFAPIGLFSSSPGFKAGEQVYAMSAYQHTIRPPKKENLDYALVQEGERVFQQAQCMTCHSGAAFTNHKIIPVSEIGTEPSRAKSFQLTKKIMGPNLMYDPNTPVPLPEETTILPLTLNLMTKKELDLAFAHDSLGGYKVKGLIGLGWSPPYLHDGGVAVGLDREKEIGIPGTLAKGIHPDPRNSLRAILDRRLREKVIQANVSAGLNEIHITGEGHEFWVDEQAGFSKREQDALIEYLLSLEINEEKQK